MGFAARECPTGSGCITPGAEASPACGACVWMGSSEQPVLDRLKPGLWADRAITSQGLYFVDRDAERQMYALYLKTATSGREPARLVYFDRP